MTLHEILRELVDHSPLNADKRDELHRAITGLAAGDAPAVPVVTPEGA
jgi:hypothetical protein